MAARLGTGTGGGRLHWLHLLLMASTVLGLARCSTLNPKRDNSEVVVVRVDEDVCADNCTATLVRLQVRRETQLAPRNIFVPATIMFSLIFLISPKIFVMFAVPCLLVHTVQTSKTSDQSLQ